MEEKDFIKELFQEKLAQHQSPVSPELWASVSSSITSGTTVVSSGLSLLTKLMIGGLSAAAVIGGIWMLTQQKTSATKTTKFKEIKKTSIQTRSNSEKTRMNPASKPTKTYEHVFLIPEIPQGDIGSSFGSGIQHSGYGSASCGPAISLSNRENEVMPILPLQTRVSDPSIHAISPNTLAIQADKVDNEPSSMEQEEIITLPNIFTPNGDGKNDVFSIDLSAFEFEDYSLVILDKNNHVVFKSNNPLESWTGKKADGELCLPGNYVYYLTGKTSEGKTISNYSNLRIQY